MPPIVVSGMHSHLSFCQRPIAADVVQTLLVRLGTKGQRPLSFWAQDRHLWLVISPLEISRCRLFALSLQRFKEAADVMRAFLWHRHQKCLSDLILANVTEKQTFQQIHPHRLCWLYTCLDPPPPPNFRFASKRVIMVAHIQYAVHCPECSICGSDVQPLKAPAI